MKRVVVLLERILKVNLLILWHQDKYDAEKLMNEWRHR